jgi:hypothetical protein
MFGAVVELLVLVLGAWGCPNAPQMMLISRPMRFPFRRRPSPPHDLARRVWAEGAAEDVPYEEFFDVLRLHAGPLSRRFAELD